MSHPTENNPFQRRSLKANYITFSVIVAVILALGSATTSFYIIDITENNAQAFQLRDAITESVSRIHKNNRRAAALLNTMVISPEEEYPQKITQHLQQAVDEIQNLNSFSLEGSPAIKDIIGDLFEDTVKLQQQTKQLIENIKDPNWVYPMLPYINNTLLESNTEFESAATLALQEIAEEENDNYSSERYKEIAQIRDLWRLQILNFRAVIVRFAGLNRIERIPQENNINLLNQEIKRKIANLKKHKDLGFETAESLIIMEYRANKWFSDYEELQKIRNSKIWRADIHFISTLINPLQADIHSDLEELEHAVIDWSSKNTTAVEAAALLATLELWGMTAVAVLFVILVYQMIARSVLTPIKIISDAITEDGKQIEHLALPKKSSYEIHTLITAYNTMRRQIHHRQMALEFQALHDSLTGLPNRALLQDRLEQAIQQAKRHRTNIAFMLLDLDRFKNINDTLGHNVGDQLLQEVSARLNHCLRTSDTVARLGGDEFAIICPDVDTTQASFFIEKVITEIEHPIVINKQNIHIGVSAGITLYPENCDNTDSMMRQADIAMYDAKHNKKNYSFFHNEMDELNVNSLSLLGELKEELRNPTENLALHFQPQINLQTNKIHSVEALLRWNHPNNGMMPPDEVVRMCEQTGLITDLTRWVLDRAISACKNWENNNLPLNIAVNLSAWDLQDNELPTRIDQLLKKYDLDPNKLTLEITESAVMQDPSRAREILTTLSNMGIRLDIDDYGTGFSSLAYLKVLPVNGLKIDKSFVIDMQSDENDYIIVQSTIDLAHNLKLIVIAEGVETLDALKSLTKNNCNFAQGYFISPPMTEAALTDWCAKSDYSI